MYSIQNQKGRISFEIGLVIAILIVLIITVASVAIHALNSKKNSLHQPKKSQVSSQITPVTGKNDETKKQEISICGQTLNVDIAYACFPNGQISKATQSNQGGNSWYGPYNSLILGYGSGSEGIKYILTVKSLTGSDDPRGNEQDILSQYADTNEPNTSYDPLYQSKSRISGTFKNMTSLRSHYTRGERMIEGTVARNIDEMHVYSSGKIITISVEGTEDSDQIDAFINSLDIRQ